MTRRDNAFYLFDTEGTPVLTLTAGPANNDTLSAVVTCVKGGATLSEAALHNLKRVVDDLLGVVES